MILFHKTIDQIAQETLNSLEAMGVNDSTPGDMVRILLTAVNEQLGTYYETLKENHMQAFISHASGERLEALGEIVQCTRIPGENDGNYKYRMINQIRSVATANETAVRLKVLSVEGVEDVILSPYSFGTGSFSAYLITTPTYDTNAVIKAAEDALAECKALGIRTAVMLPKERELEIKMRIVFNKRTRESEKVILLNSIKEQIRVELSQLTIGDALDISMFERIARTLSSDIETVTLFDMRIDGRAVIVKNYNTKWNERVVEASKYNAIMVI